MALNVPLHVPHKAIRKQHSLSQLEKGGGHAELTFFEEVMRNRIQNKVSIQVSIRFLSYKCCVVNVFKDLENKFIH